MTLEEVRDVFLSVLPDDTFHYEAWKKPDRYIVWAEDGQANALHADDKMQEQVFSGTVDLFTKTEFDFVFHELQKAMNDASISFRLESSQKEDKTKFFHFEWVWEVLY